MKTTVYMIRHGESQANLEGKFLGHGDLDLTETGHKQAACTAAYLKDVPCDAIYASDLRRAFHTAEHTAALKGMTVIPAPQLREIHGGAWELCTFEELHERFAEDFGRWIADIDRAAPTDGESVAALQQRIVAEVKRLAARHAGGTVFLFTHATPVRVAAAHSLGQAVGAVPWAANASVTRLSCEDGVLTLEEYGYNDFMGELVTTLPANV